MYGFSFQHWCSLGSGRSGHCLCSQQLRGIDTITLVWFQANTNLFKLIFENNLEAVNLQLMQWYLAAFCLNMLAEYSFPIKISVSIVFSIFSYLFIWAILPGGKNILAQYINYGFSIFKSFKFGSTNS